MFLAKFVLNYDAWWYNSAIAFPIGMFFYEIHNKCASFVKGHPKAYWFSLICSCMMIAVSRVVKYLFEEILNIDGIGFILDTCMVVFTLLFVALLYYKFRIQNVILNFYGKISFEIYLMHGLMILIFRNDVFLYVQNDLLFALLVLITSTIVAYFMNRLDSFIFSKVLTPKKIKV